MKLANQSIKYVSASLLVIVGIWSVVFYFNMLAEIKESVDEELENYKRQLVFKVQTTPSILDKKNFDEAFYSVKEISQKQALSFTDEYLDTEIYMQDADDEAPELEPVRMLVTTFEHEGKYYELQIINSMVEEDDLIKELLWEAIILYVILIASIVIVNNFVLRKVWKPFYHFLEQLRNYRIGSDAQLPNVKTTTTEFNDLQQSVDTLLRKSIEAYDQQKQFIGNASHELQTPLAIVIGKLELLLEKQELQNAQAESVSEVLQIVERLVRLNKSLLLLTKIENRQFLDNSLVSMNQVAKQTISDFEDLSEFRKVSVSLVEKSELSVNMDLALANIIVSNLLKNAIFHSESGANVEIEILANQLVFRNDGQSALDHDQIFKHFYKSGDKTSGTGLGLAIVKAICSVYDFRVSYEFRQSKHVFSIGFQKG